MPIPNPPSADDWAAIRHRYEATNDATADICADAGITQAQLKSIVRREAWRRQFPRPFPPVGRRSTAPPRGAATTARARRIAPASPDTPGSSQPSKLQPGPPRPVAPESLLTPTPAAPPSPQAIAPADGAASQPNASTDVWRAILARLAAATCLKLEQLEHRMSKDLAADKAGTPTNPEHDREARALGSLTDNLSTMTEIDSDLETRANGGKSAAITADLADEADRRRSDLAERIRKLIDAAAEKA